MRYLLLIYSEEGRGPEPGTPAFDELMRGYYAFGDEVRRRGVYQAGEALQPIATATSVRVRDGQRLVTDGPFAETKEQLGGFYMLDCKDLDEALELAAKIPSAAHGTVEVRPIQEFS